MQVTYNTAHKDHLYALRFISNRQRVTVLNARFSNYVTLTTPVCILYTACKTAIPAIQKMPPR